MWPFNDRKRPKGFRRIMLLQELEQRIVLDAAVADQPQQDNVDPGVDGEAGAQAAGAGQPAVQAADQPAAKGVAPNQAGSDHPLDVILVSNALTDVSAVSGAAVSDSTVIVYDAAQDTLSSVTAKLNDLVATTGEKIDHIAILSHGEAGILKLSSTSFFDVASVQANPADWHTLSTLLTGDARIDLYACSLGQGVQGLALVQSIAQATGATVWASDDMTGTATGADWDLEVKSASSGLGSLIDPEAVIVSGLYLASVPIVDGQTVSVSEDGTLTITVTGSDSDDPDPSMVSFTVTNSVTHGALSVIGAVSRASAGHYSQQFQYIPTYDYNGSDSFEFVMTTPTDDTSDPATVSITVSPVNDAPVNTVPDVVQDTLPDGSIVFSAANGNQILVSDIDAGTGFLKVTVTATHGTLTLNGLSGLTFDPGQGDGTADATMVFTGTLADINNALDGMTFTRDAGYVGMASVTVAVNDQGNTGEGGPQSATDTVSISAEPYGAWFAGFGAEAGWDVFNYEGGSFYTQDYTAYWRCEDPGTWSFWNGAAWVATDNVGNAPYGDGFGPYATWFVDTVAGGTYVGYEVYIAQGVKYFSLDHDATGATYWRVADAPEWSYYDGSAWYSTGGFQVEPMNVWFHGSGDYAGWDVYNYDVGSYYTQDYSAYWRYEDPGTWSFWSGTGWVTTDNVGNAPYGDGFGPYGTWFVDTVAGGTYVGYEVYIAQGVKYFSLDHDATGATYWRVADAPEWSYYDGSAWYSTGGFQVEPMNVWFHGSGDYAGWDVYNYDVGSYYTQDYSLYWRCEDPDTWSFWNGTAWVATDELGNAPYGDGFGPYATWFEDNVVGGTYAGYEVYIGQGVTYFSLDHPAAGATYWKLSNAGDWSYYDGTAWNATGGFLVEPPNAWFHGFGIHAGWEVYNYTGGSYYTHEYALYWQHVDDGIWKYYDGASWYGWWPNIGQFAAAVAGSQDQYVPVSGWPLGTLTDYPPGFGNEVFIVGIPSNGTLWHDADGNGSYETALDLGAAVPVSHVLANRIVYSGNANWAGDDSFSYALFEGDAGVVVPICIASVPDQTNQEPVANAHSVTAQEDLPLQISLTGDDGDPNVVQALTYFLDSLPGNGALYGSEADARAATNPLGITQLAGNTLWYKSGTNDNSDTSFTFHVRDDGGTDNGGDDTSSVATVNVTVTPVNDSPSASNFTQMYTVGENSGALNFSDIIVTDPDGLDTFTATLTLADHAAGVLSTSNGAAFNSTTGVWTVSGGLDQVNAALADVTFAPNEGWHGACVISTHLVDSKGAGPSDGVILIEVTYSHSAPISVSGTEDVAVVIDGWAYEGSFNPTAIVIKDLPEHGRILCNGLVISAPGSEIPWDQAVSGSMTFKGDADWNGTTTFHYSVKDSAGSESAASLVTVILAPEDDAPATAPFIETGYEDSSIVVDGWVYDGSKDDVAGGSSGRSAMQVTVVTLPETGTLYHDGVSVTSPNYVIPWADAVGGKVTFIGPEDWNGYTTFEYLVTDTGGHSSASATVTVYVAVVNDEAVVNSFSITTDEDTNVVISGWNYDDSKDNVADGSQANTPWLVTVYTNAAHGTLYYGYPLHEFFVMWDIPWEHALDGLLTYKPDPGWSGNDSFSYSVSDQGGYQSSAVRTVYVTVNQVNDAPQIEDFTETGIEDSLPIDDWSWYYAYFDDSADGAQASDPSFITIKGLTPAGTIYHNGVPVTTSEYDVPWSERATLEFVPVENWNGTTSVPYTITDEGGAESNRATITFEIAPRNDLPLTKDFSISGHEDTDIVLFGWYFDDSADSVPGGSSMDKPDNVTIELYLPFHGSLYHNGVQITTLGYEIPWQDAIDGLVSFRPDPNWNGSDEFFFSVSDDNGSNSYCARASITSIPVNDRAIAVDFSESMLEDWYTSLTGWGFDDDSDYVFEGSTENTPDHITIVDLPAHGVLSYNSTPITTTGFTVPWTEAKTGGVLVFAPEADWNGVTTFRYTVTDDQGEVTTPATATLTVTAVDDKPISGDFSISGQTGVTIAVQGWIHDDSKDQVSGGSSANPPDYVTIKWLPAQGALYHNGAQITTTNYNIPWADATSGAVSYVADSWYGSTWFKYDVTSVGGKSSGTPWATVNVVVNPCAGVQDFSSSGFEDTPTSITGWVFTGGGGTTADHVTIESLPLNGTLYYDGAAISATGFTIPWADAKTAGKVTFLGTEDWNGSTSFLYSLTDNLGSQSADGAATMQITESEDAPQAGAFTETGTEDSTVVINGWMFDDDRDQVPGGSSADSPTEVTIVWLSTHGTLCHDSTAITSPNYQIPWADAIDGTITFQPDADWNGNTEISYTVTDSGGLTSSWSTATICIGTVDDHATSGAMTVSGNEDTIIQLNTWTYSDAADDIYGGSGANTPKFITIEDYPETGYLFHDNEIILHSGYRIPWSDAVTYGKVYFQPFPDWNGSTSFYYSITDDTGWTTPNGTVQITVNPVNDTPGGVAFSVTGDEDSAIVIDDWTFYDSRDEVEGGSSANAPVSLFIESLPWHGHLFHNGTAITTTDYAVTWAEALAGAVTYQGNENWNGTDRFYWSVTDDGGKQSPWVKAEIVVNPVSDSPVAGDVNLVGHEDQELKLYGWYFNDNADYSLNGSRPNAAQQVKIVDLPDHGSIYHNGVVVSSAGYLIPWEDAQSWGKVTFKPTDDWNGATSFHYAVVDDSGAESAAALFTVTIEPVNDVPSAQGFSETGSEDTVIVIDGWNIDDSRDQVSGGSSADAPDSVTILSLPEHGTLYHNGTAVVTTGHVVSWADASGGTVTFQALQDWNGTASFFWAVTDTAGNQVEGMGASLVVNPVNDAHTIYDTEMEGYSGEKIWLNSHLLAFDDQRDEVPSGSHANQPASLTIVDLPAFGTLYFNDIAITAPGLSVPWAEADHVYFLCTGDQVGSTFFHCDVIDETGQAAMGSATVSISASISGAYDSEFTIFTEQGAEETAVVIDSWASYAGGGGATPASVTISSLPLNGTLSHNGVAITATGYAIPWSDATSGTVTFSPDQHWNGVAYIAFTFVDSGGTPISSSSVVVVTVVPANDPAVAGNFSESGLEDTTLVVNGWVYDDSIDKVPLGSEPQDPALIRITSVPENGTLFHGINPINTANYEISWNDAVTGSVTFLGQDNWNGETSFVYIIVDETGLAGSAGTATLIITPDFGGAEQFSEVGNEDTVIAVDGWRFEPPAGGVSPVSIRIDTLPYEGYGSLYYNGSLIGSNHFDVSWADAVSSTVTFVPIANWSGNTSFCYSVLDSTGTRTSSVEATITVTPVDDPHTISDYVAKGLEEVSVSLWPVQNRYFDIDGDKPVSLTIVSLPANGTLKSGDSPVVLGQELSWARVSSLKFDGDLDWFGTTTFQYTVTDSSGWTTAQPATVSITLEDTHDFPRALSFTESGNQGDTVVIDSWGATSGEGGYASVRLYSLNMYNGQLFHNGVPIVTEGYEIPWSEAVGSLVTYRSSHPQSQGDCFLFTVVDGTGQESLFAVAKIELTPVDDPLQIISDAKFFGSEDQVTAVEWYLGYSDPDLYSEGTTDEPVYLKILTRPPSSEGNLYLNGWLITSDGVQIRWPEAQDGSVEFMPSHNWFGTTTFTYKLIDGKGRESSNTGTATISITSVDDPTEIKGPGTWWVQYAKPGIPLTFSTANDNEVYLEDPDGDNPQVSVTLEANAETAVLTLGSTSNVTAWSELDGRKWTVQGDLADVNNALEELTYTVNLKSTAGLEEVYFGDVNRIDIRVTNLDGAYCDGESIDVGIVPAQMYDGHVYWEYVESSEYHWYWADNAGFTDEKVFKGEIEYRPDEEGPLQTWNGSQWIAMNGGLFFRDEGLYTYRSTSTDFDTSLHDGIGYDGEPVTRTQVGWDPSMNAYLYTADGVYSGQQLLKWYVRDPGSDSASDITALFVEYSPAQDNTANRPNYLKAEITAPMVNVVFYDPSSYTLEEWAKDVQLLSYIEGTPGQNTFIDTLGIWAHGYTNQFDVGLDIITYGTSGVGGDSNQMYFYCWDDPYVRDNFKEIGEVLNGTDSQIQIWECSVAGNNDFDPDHQARRMLRGIAWHSGATVCASSDLNCIWPEGWAAPTDRNTPSVPEWEEEPDDGQADDPVDITGAFLSFAKPGDLCDYQLEYITTADAKMDGSAMREGMWSFDKLKSGGRDVGPYLNESSSSDKLAGWLPWEHTRF